MHCKYVSTDITGDQNTTVLAAVSVTPCDAACGWMISTRGSVAVWNLLKISPRSRADTLPEMISFVCPSLVKKLLSYEFLFIINIFVLYFILFLLAYL